MVSEHIAAARNILGTRPEGVTVPTYDMMVAVLAGALSIGANQKARIVALESMVASQPRRRAHTKGSDQC